MLLNWHCSLLLEIRVLTCRSKWTSGLQESLKQCRFQSSIIHSENKDYSDLQNWKRINLWYMKKDTLKIRKIKQNHFADERYNEVLEYFEYRPKDPETGLINQEDIVQVFLVIGKRVSWDEAEALCTTYGNPQQNENIYDIIVNSNNDVAKNTIKTVNESITEKKNPGSRLAMIWNKNLQKWLSQKLSESNYKYDGLWIGGRRKDMNSDWMWTNKNVIIPKDMVLSAYPNWYELPNHLHAERNCLIMDKQGHDVPRFLPENCQLRRPCICETIDKRKVSDKERIVETAKVTVSGYHYTLYTVADEEYEDLNNFGVKRLNGGGITWKEAQVECRKREKHLALIFGNDVAVSIADVMMKSRPSMESIWLGAWSSDGCDWSWISSGSKLPSVKSNVSLYPPWLPGHPIILSDEEYNQQRSGRCLILDRHLCPDHVSPVFLDLDCDKSRPFLCQDVTPDDTVIENDNLYIAMEDAWLMISESYVTFDEGIDYCKYHYGRVASIFDFKSLALVLEKMTELSLDHLWVGGRTKYINGEYKWLDENDEVLKRNGIGARSSWCLGGDGSSFPKAEFNTCLNLDREARGLPLFYGLPCNGTKQHVLCRISYSNDTNSNGKFHLEDYGMKNSQNINSQSKKSLITSMSIAESKLDQSYERNKNMKISANETIASEKNVFGFLDNLQKFRATRQLDTVYNITEGIDKVSANYHKEHLTCGSTLGKNLRVTDLDEDLQRLLNSSDHVIDDNDHILGLEFELVHLDDETSDLISTLASRISRLTNAPKSGILFVIDDSISILNAWLAVQFKLASVIIRKYFPISKEHPLGLITFSKRSKVIFDFNQTEECSAINSLVHQLFVSRGLSRDDEKVDDFTTSLIDAVDTANSIVLQSNLSKTMTIFITDGEHSEETSKVQVTVEKIRFLRNAGHEVLAIIILQGQNQSYNNDTADILFNDRSSSEENLFHVKDYKELEELVTSLNTSILAKNLNSECKEPAWIVPKDEELLLHLLQKK